MKIALVQLDSVWEDAAASHARVLPLLERAAEAGARIAVLPEMFATGFSMQPERVAQEPGGASETFLRERAAALGMWLLASIPERVAGGRPRNVALVVSPGGEVKRYAKIHPFSFAGEDRVYDGGDRVVTLAIEGLRVTPFVCYDLRFPEPFRLAAEDTDLFVVVANWPEARREHWRTLLRARAIENLAFVAGVNRSGEGGGLRYAGDSVLVSPWGETVVGDAGGGESVMIGEVDGVTVAEARARFPVLGDRRPFAYRR